MISPVILEYRPSFSGPIELRQVAVRLDGKPIPAEEQPIHAGSHEIQLMAQFIDAKNPNPINFAQAFNVKLSKPAHARVVLTAHEGGPAGGPQSVAVAATLEVLEDISLLKKNANVEEVAAAVSWQPQIEVPEALQRQGEHLMNDIRTCISPNGDIMSQTLITHSAPIFDGLTLTLEWFVKYKPNRGFCFVRPNMYTHQ